MTCGLRSLGWGHFLIAYVALIFVLLFGTLAHASTDPVKDTRQIMAGTVTTTKVKNEYLSGARDGTTAFKGALSAYKAVRAAEVPVPAPTPAPTPTPTPTPVPLPTGAYDTSIGMGVDAGGFAILPLRSGAHRYFVNSATGSDANGCAGAQAPATPLKTIDAGKGCVTLGNGDQILIAEGTSYVEGLTNLQAQMGFSAAYPTVVQSYDPADPMNEAKLGHASNGRRPVVNTGGNLQQLSCCGSNANQFLAIRGLDFNPGDKPDMGIAFVSTANYILLENNLFRYTSVGFDIGSSPRASHHVIRHNSFYGQWSPTGSTGGIYDAGTDGSTIEDNIFWHTGWRLGVSRDSDVATGGPTYFRHPIYQQNNSQGFVVRRNVFMDGAADGGSLRGSVIYTLNVSIDNPIGVGVGANLAGGSLSEVSYNAILGDADVKSTEPRGQAILFSNGLPGSSVHHNLIARSRDPNGVNTVVYNVDASLGNQSTFDIHDNISFMWAAPGRTRAEYGGAALHLTYNNNVWDDPALGTNLNIASKAIPNPLTSAQLFAALGCVDKVTCAPKMVETPELPWADRARTLLFAGYGIAQ
jgi:hypothetical protein